MMKFLTTILLACAAGSALASPVKAEDAEKLVRSFVEDVQSMTARFEQTLVDADDNIVEESGGQLEILRPGRFRWSYQEPYEQLLVADGVNVWSYDADLAQVTVQPQQEVLGSTPATLLGGAGDVMANFEIAESFEDRGTVWVRLLPLEEDSGFSSLDLGFDDGTLSRMIFLDALGQSTLIALFEVTVNATLAAERFAFVPPADADLVGTPLPQDRADL